MTTALRVARIATLIALIGFVFPWVLVSCQGEPVGRLTGLDLATGGLTHQGSGSALLRSSHPNLWVTLSLAGVIAAFALSLLLKARGAIVAVVTAAVIALAASAVGVSTVASEGQVEVQRPPQGTGIDLQFGYLVTVAGLLAAIVACGAALASRGDGPGGRGTGAS